METKLITIPYKPRDYFLPLHNRTQRFSVTVAHRRAGKTVAEVNDKIKTALTCQLPNPRTAYIAPYYKQAKAVAWTYAKESSIVIPGTKINESELRIDYPNGGQFRLYGADNPDALRGIYLDDVTLDECADMNPRLFPEVIRPALVDRNGRASFIGTPKGKNEFYHLCEFAKKSPDWFFLELRASQTKIINPQELLALKAEMTEEQFLQEFECSFDAAILGAYYGKEMYAAQESGRIKKFDYDPNYPVFTNWDLGWSDDTAIWFYQIVGKEIRILEYYYANGQNIDHFADYVLSRPWANKYETHWLPHDAKAKTLASGGKSIQEQLSVRLGWDKIRIVTMLSIQDGIQAVRTMFPRLWFNSAGAGMQEGMEALRQYQREWDDQRKCFRDYPRHDWTSHPSDAFRGIGVSWREIYKSIEKPEPQKDTWGRFFKDNDSDWKTS